jgi:DNA helicase II / ATP-dependent DNA helicase PcrA
MDQNILKKEKQHLEQTLSKVKSAKDRVDASLGALGNANLAQLADLRNSPESSGSDLMLFVQQLHEKNQAFNRKDKVQRLEEFEYLMNEPYFARIDLGDANEEEQFYIGKFGFTDETPIIIDWRAKLASIYYRYRYPQKNVKYTTHEGEYIKDLLLKRTFEIDSGELVKYYNNDIQLDEDSIIAGKIEERTGGVLEDIIETIQEEQMDIIEADPRKICIVQGSVGSGKSTVAIHKLSHIFFNHADLIKPEMSILIAKSPVLVSYLATLFPKLGIFDINYKTLNDLIINVIFREELKITVDLHDTKELSEYSLADVKDLEGALRAIHEEYTNKIKKILEDEEFASFNSFVYNQNQSIEENLSEYIAEMHEELAFQKEKYNDNPKSVKSWVFKENMTTIRKLVKKVQKIKADLNEKAFPQLCKDLGINTKEKLNAKQALIYLYLHHEFFGFKKSLKYQYCVIDEGQDFSVLEYLILGKLVQKGRFCILGDLNQSYLDEGLTTWDHIKEVIHDARAAQTFELTTNYRSTKQIISFANKILSPFTDSYLPKSIDRQGQEPKIITPSEINDVMSDIKKRLHDELKDLNKSIGIITFDDSLYNSMETVFEELRAEHQIPAEHFVKLAGNSHVAYVPKGVYLAKFEDCKGLEFSEVYVLGLDVSKINDFSTAKKAFVAVTRAMNDLYIYPNKN